ncbi:MAG: hypothetical protein FWD93_01600 [Coriobacteriia bacterium]|nr:hypothetical protein [Coriobacteriia bacterium]
MKQADLITGICGVSFVKDPRDFTTMYVGKKFEANVKYLTDSKGCLLFFEDGMDIPQIILDNNNCHFSVAPVRDFARAVRALWEQRQAELGALPYFNQNGATVGTDVELGEGVVIEPGAFIDHRVKIGAGTRICTGAVVRHGSVIGENCLILEGAVIGNEGFTMAPDEDGNPFRLHCLAGVILADEVEVGANVTVNRGQSRDTFVERWTKIDDGTYVAHDCVLGERVTVTSNVTMGGFVEVGDGAYLGMNCTVKQLLSVGAGTTVGMGSVVTKSLPDGVVAFGSPAKVRG